ncbi:MAG: iron-sulfur cluster assembly accessory protein [Rickettsiales bacterium]|jgi:iron-sulfur cluster assembly protein|nr:iron-sulfur cluster assembly accessory protein [Rickettsiales bacterium]
MTNYHRLETPYNNKVIDYLSITDEATTEIMQRVTKRTTADPDHVCYGIKIGLKTKGCSGLTYNIEYALENNITAYDELAESDIVNVFIDPKISLFIFNTTMDFHVKTSDNNTIIESGFVFKNPNEKGRCGCGESFYV